MKALNETAAAEVFKSASTSTASTSSSTSTSFTLIVWNGKDTGKWDQFLPLFVEFKQEYSLPGGGSSGGFKSKEAVLARLEIRKQVIKHFLSEDLNYLCDQFTQSNFEKEFEKYIRLEESNETRSGSFYEKVFDLMASMNSQMTTVMYSEDKKQLLATRANDNQKHGSFVVDEHVYAERVQMLRSESQ